MARLVDADKLMERFRIVAQSGGHVVVHVSDICAAIEDEAIEDAVEIVRCKDCKHRGDYGCPMYHEEYIEWDDDGHRESEIVEHDRTRDDGFCDLGERRTDNG